MGFEKERGQYDGDGGEGDAGEGPGEGESKLLLFSLFPRCAGEWSFGEGCLHFTIFGMKGEATNTLRELVPGPRIPGLTGAY